MLQGVLIMWQLQNLWHVVSAWCLVAGSCSQGETVPCALVGTSCALVCIPLCISVPPVPSTRASGLSSYEEQVHQENGKWGGPWDCGLRMPVRVVSW